MTDPQQIKDYLAWRRSHVADHCPEEHRETMEVVESPFMIHLKGLLGEGLYPQATSTDDDDTTRIKGLTKPPQPLAEKIRQPLWAWAQVEGADEVREIRLFGANGNEEVREAEGDAPVVLHRRGPGYAFGEGRCLSRAINEFQVDALHVWTVFAPTNPGAPVAEYPRVMPDDAIVRLLVGEKGYLEVPARALKDGMSLRTDQGPLVIPPSQHFTIQVTSKNGLLGGTKIAAMLDGHLLRPAC